MGSSAHGLGQALWGGDVLGQKLERVGSRWGEGELVGPAEDGGSQAVVLGPEWGWLTHGCVAQVWFTTRSC